MLSPLILLTLLSLLISSSLSQIIGPICDESYVNIFSVTSRSNVAPGQSLVNITTTDGLTTYRTLLPRPYLFNAIDLIIGLPITEPLATFQIFLNNAPQTANGQVINFPFSTNGTLVTLAPFLSQGTANSVNNVTIIVTNRNENNDITCSMADTFLITNPMIGGAVTGDPQFIGLRGQAFQVHGIDGAIYNLISDSHTQINSRFVFLNGPRPCPVMPSTKKESRSCWSHAGSYLGEIGLKTSSGQKLLIEAGDAFTGFDSITLDDQPLKSGGSYELNFLNTNIPTGFIHFNNSHEISIKSSFFELEIENIDGFLNLRSVSVETAKWHLLQSHGLLGQTWQNRRYSGTVKEIQGEIDDYVIMSDDIFGDDFLFNKFETESQ